MIVAVSGDGSRVHVSSVWDNESQDWPVMLAWNCGNRSGSELA